MEFLKSNLGWGFRFSSSKIGNIKDTFGADSVAGLSSARTCNEDNFAFQKMMRVAIGTNNVDHCARTRHAPTVAGGNNIRFRSKWQTL